MNEEDMVQFMKKHYGDVPFNELPFVKSIRE